MEWEVKADVEQDSAPAPMSPDAPLLVGVAADAVLAWGAELVAGAVAVASGAASSRGWDVAWGKGNGWTPTAMQHPLPRQT